MFSQVLKGAFVAGCFLRHCGGGFLLIPGVLLALKGSLAGQTQYEVIRIPGSAGFGPGTSLGEINDKGEGLFNFGGELVLWLPEPAYGESAGLHELGDLEDLKTGPRLIQFTNSGHFVVGGTGWYGQGTTLREMAPIPDGEVTRTVNFWDVNNSGEYVGQILGLHPFLYDGQMNDLSPRLPPDPSDGRYLFSPPFHITDEGTLMGRYQDQERIEIPTGGVAWRGREAGIFFHKAGVRTDTVPISSNSLGTSITDVNQAESFLFTTFNSGNFIPGLYLSEAVSPWNREGYVGNLDQAVGGFPRINDHYQGAGFIFPGGDGPAPLYWDRGIWRDVRNLTFPEGFVPFRVHDINNVGQFLVSGFVPDEPGEHVYLLTPNLVVNDPGDESDADPNDGVVNVDLEQEGFQVTLRAAIEEANRDPARSEITFNIEGAGTPVISPQAPLPALTAEIVIDGTSQPGAGLVCLDGRAAPDDADGLMARASSTFKGLEIINFKGGAGIRLTGARDHVIRRCFLGTDSQDTAGLGNKTGLLAEDVTHTIIGRPGNGEANIVAGNQEGVRLRGGEAIEIRHTYIGTTRDGHQAQESSVTGLSAEGVRDLRVGRVGELVTVIGGQTAVALENSSAVIANVHLGVEANGQSALAETARGLVVANSEVVQLLGKEDRDHPGANSLVSGSEVRWTRKFGH